MTVDITQGSLVVELLTRIAGVLGLIPSSAIYFIVIIRLFLLSYYINKEYYNTEFKPLEKVHVHQITTCTFHKNILNNLHKEDM